LEARWIRAKKRGHGLEREDREKDRCKERKKA
jgi:hypothetical protein